MANQRLYTITRRISIGLMATAFLVVPALSQTPLSVLIKDVNLVGAQPSEVLTLRFIQRMETICGSAQSRGLSAAMVGPKVAERFAECKASLRVEPDANPVVRASFAEALSRFN